MKLLFDQNISFRIIKILGEHFPGSSQDGHPPKISWLRTGNIRTVYIANLVIQKEEQIINFFNDEGISCLEIY